MSELSTLGTSQLVGFVLVLSPEVLLRNLDFVGTAP